MKVLRTTLAAVSTTAVIWGTALLSLPAFSHAQSANQLLQELADITQKMTAAEDMCAYAKQLESVMEKLIRADDEVRTMMQPMVDDMKKTFQRRCSTPVVEKPAYPNVVYRGSAADSRPLTSAEERELMRSLRWTPALVSLRLRGTGQSRLVDRQGLELATIRLRWDDVRQPRNPGSNYNPSVAYFTILLENKSELCPRYGS